MGGMCLSLVWEVGRSYQFFVSSMMGWCALVPTVHCVTRCDGGRSPAVVRCDHDAWNDIFLVLGRLCGMLLRRDL